MKGLVFFFASIALLFLACEAFAHGGARVAFVPDGFGGVRAVIVQDNFVTRGFHHVGPRFVPRGNFHHIPRGVSPFNQNGGRNRIGFRR